MKKILVVNVNWLGDVIFTTPVFKALKKHYPDATISCLAVPRVRPILESIPYIDEIIEYDEKGRHFNPFAKLTLIISLRKKCFDTAFLLHRSFTRALLIFLAGIPRRVGYDEKNHGKLLTHIVSPLNGNTHRSQYYFNVVKFFGVPVEDEKCELCVDQESIRCVENLLEQHNITSSDRVAVVNTGGNWDLKRWPEKNFALLIDSLADEFNIKVIISGAKKDKQRVERIIGLTRKGPVVLVGRTTILQAMALFKKSNIVISADSGPLHMAAAVGANTIGIFGPTRPEITGPRGVGKTVSLQTDVGCNRKPCYYLKCPDNSCGMSFLFPRNST